MATSPSPTDSSVDVEKVSYEIFSILESKFLFGYDDNKLFLSGSSTTTPAKTPSRPAFCPGKIRILSIDAVSDCLLAAASLARLESSLRRLSGNRASRISDYFDVAAGSGAGGVLAALLFARGPDGRSLFSAEDALSFLIKSGLPRDFAVGRKGLFQRFFRRDGGGTFRRVFGGATLRDTVKPLLIPCFDLSTSAPFLFSRADAVEADAYNFQVKDVCAATCAGREAVQVSSVDGRTRFAAVGGEMAMANPTAAAITHVLHNKQEFPSASRVDDLLVLSIGSVHPDHFVCRSSPSKVEGVRIAGKAMAEMVDQAIAMAFGQRSVTNYVRIQPNDLASKALASNVVNRDAERMLSMAEAMMIDRSLESVLFEGKRLSKETNGEKLERMAGELIREQERRSKSPLPTVVVKQAMTPRTSSATTSTATTTSTGRTFGSP
ncbi:hypothetical protein HPP92_011849 [Vanilla planifolia]|uniref:PNPLA domain-containing protein n=1 Tax=Vanilla planifolia TaxID=51239 RepID=A0A835R4F5_VANPL|nr:hypothetical protein HPP92_012193 [Vanilla planifolia]KAG0483765.1 hypothetical protein HPP92_011849 [Vanilla planifolia]